MTEAMNRKKVFNLIVSLILTMCISACAIKSTEKYTLAELPEIEWEEISNAIPEWVIETHWNKTLYAVSEENIDDFNQYALENFPSYCDSEWTQEQSDAVCLGMGIRMFVLDGQTEINKIIYYPVILNGVIVGGYQVYENNEGMNMQASPFFVNQLNVLMDLTSENSPLILGYNNDNLIAIIGDTYYVLDEDHLRHQDVDVSKIPVIDSSIYIDAMNVICTERTANVEDWIMYYRDE